MPDLVRECRKWRWCQTHFFSTLPIEQGTVWAVGKSREACADSQPKSVSGHKLNGLNQALIPLLLDCAAHEGQAEPRGEMGHGYVTVQAWPSLFF